jgi:hypothetical protein
MSKKPVQPHGYLRRSQVITTFGPGALMDLPTQGVLIAGLDLWGNPEQQGFEPVLEERLVAKLSTLFDGRKVRLFMPPAESDDPERETQGMRAWQFPGWFVAQYEDAAMLKQGVRSRPLVSFRTIKDSKGKYRADDKKLYKVLPIRFVQACINGHISDLNWYAFAHREGNPSCRRPLWLDEQGTSGDLADIRVRCECGARQPLVIATQVTEGKVPLGMCNGERTWLGLQSDEACGGSVGPRQPNRLLVRSASNAYFPQVLSVISIPDGDAALREAVKEAWSDLEEAEDEGDVAREIGKKKYKQKFAGHSPEAVWAEVQRQKGDTPAEPKRIKPQEFETLVASRDELGEDRPDGDFFARRFVPPDADVGPVGAIERVVLVHRLREVMAQVGFTRFEPSVADIDGELALDVRRAELAREVTWLPAIENRGEGVFLSFKQKALVDWLARPRVRARVGQLEAGFKAWQRSHPGSTARFPGATYVMLHSLSHLLITAIALDCGYSSSAIRERIYVTDAGCGILLYTGSFDAEGTLGGLVEAGRRVGQHLHNALDLARLCSNDPVCAQHRPDNQQEERYLHGAACHGCLLIGETSCERRNEHLDRALVVATVEEHGAEFFVDEAT